MRLVTDGGEYRCGRLVDVHMRGMSGIEATRLLKQRRPQVQVIGLTAIEEDEIILNMLQAGACSYIVKSMAAHEMVKAIRAAYEREPWVPTAIQRRLYHLMGRHGSYRPSISKRKPHSLLTERELDVVKILIEGYSNKEIAVRLVISERTVQTHLSNIFGKMNVTNRTEAVLVAMRDGWLVKH
ncbi:MAG TPA: response regulator transcription factor [Caldilineaceae bacterium]|nr:response regulator transcription factor [Caldilineaceae bacterium]